MRKYDKEYYFIESSDDESNPLLTPDDATADRKFRYEAQVIGAKPLIFFNGMKEYQRKNGIPSLNEPPAILFSGSNPVVLAPVKEALLKLNIENMHICPTIYMHDDKKMYPDYWFLAFSERFDCWDRNNSDYDQEIPPIRLGGFDLEQVYTFSLNENIFDRTPLKRRLLFQMGGSLSALFVCHESLIPLFESSRKSGVKITSVSDF